jgi:carboxyl-terminal processing protease
VDYEILFDNAIRGMLIELDPHSSFLNAKALNELATATQGEFSGLGIEVLPEKGLMRVISPIDDTPAKRAGIRSGDIIIRINETPLKQMTADEAIEMMRGKQGSEVILTILRENERKPLKIKVIRDVIRVKTVHGRLLEKGYGYVRLSFFQSLTGKSLRKVLKKLQHDAPKHHLNGIILDLRNNPGGLLDAAIDVSDIFIDAKQAKKYHGLLVYTQGRFKPTNLRAKAKTGDAIQGVPMVVLINGGSASASEIVAGALQDYQRALIVGSKSFGKGSVQTVLPISKNNAIKLTTALYYTPAGRAIQAKGIQPDIEIPEIRMPKAQTVNEFFAFDSLKESDLTGHIKNGNKRKAAAKKAQQQTAHKKRMTLIKQDFQLFEALNLLKGLHLAHLR